MADDGRIELPEQADRCPEAQETERGDDWRQDERCETKHLEDVRPGRDAPPQEPGKRQRDGNGDRGRADSQRDRMDQRQPPFRIVEDLPVPGERKALWREGQFLLLVDRDASDDDQRRGQEQRDKHEIEPAKHDHSAFSLRPTSSVRPTSASEIRTRNTAMAAANGMLDW
ncbi:conserved hypothetical protein [Ricinus communis]|uniref:Uncharacterized protein n=1 Tax=Ricinus communis TaxID=3988 RepID=B9TKS7_RICCO|nr:conserved hypothetical protein [Ricinus communis]